MFYGVYAAKENLKNEVLLSSDEYGIEFILKGENIQRDSFDLIVRYEYKIIHNKRYLFLKEGKQEFFVDDSDSKLNFCDEIVDAISVTKKDITPDVLYGLSRKNGNKITSCNIKENSFIEVPEKCHSTRTYISGFLVCFSKRKKTLFCLNDRLKSVWEHSFEVGYGQGVSKGASNVNTPVAYGDGFIINLGADKTEYQYYIDKGHDGSKNEEINREVYLRSDLRYYHVQTGNLQWQQSVIGEIQQYQIVDDIIFLCTLHLLVKICAKTGETLQAVDTGLTSLFDRHQYGNSLYVVDGLIFYSHNYDKKFIVFSSKDLSFVRDLLVPNPWVISPYNIPYYHKQTHKLYFQMTKYDPQCWVKSGIMEIDPINIGADVEVEQSPDFTFDIISSKEKPTEKELLITSKEDNLMDMLRFSEGFLRDKAFEHGLSFMGSFSCTEAFNGKVHFHYLGNNVGHVDQEATLDMLEQRFNLWAENTMYGSDNQTPCVLITNKSKANIQDKKNKLTEKSEKERLKIELDRYYFYTENGDSEYFENAEFITEMGRVAKEAIKCGLLAKGHYFLSIAYRYENNTEADIEHLLYAAKNGFIDAIIEYAHRKGVNAPEIVGLLKMCIDDGIDLGSFTEDVNTYLSQLTSNEISVINNEVLELRNTISFS